MERGGLMHGDMQLGDFEALVIRIGGPRPPGVGANPTGASKFLEKYIRSLCSARNGC